MFTGIIEEIGTVLESSEHAGGRRMRISAAKILDDLKLGDSVAVDGVCLTVSDLLPGAFAVDAVGTTLGRTTLGELTVGSRVNLERAAALGDRLGGHLVQGHVDGIGRVRSIRAEEAMLLIDIEMPPAVADVTVLHGSITMNGISLTVNEIPGPGIVQVSIIPFTRDHTTIADLREGRGVNLEGDLIGKYVRQFVRPGPTGDSGV